MTKFPKKSISYILAIILIFTSVFTVNIQVSAASYPTTHPNTYKNTGDNVVDIVGVAKTQVGYKKNSVGTKYGYWYNKTFVNQPWCAMFVSWCAEQSEVPQTVIQKFASCSIGVRWFKSIGCWEDSAYYGGDYVPKKGDIVFYRNRGSSNVSDHVGIVLGVNGTYLHVIEGNATNESVYEYKTNTSRTLNNQYVIGYATPNYERVELEEPLEEEPTTYERWQITSADALSLRKEHATDSKRLRTIPLGTVMEVTEFYVAEDYLWGKTAYKGKKGWCALDYCTYIDGSVNGEYYQMPPSTNQKSLTIYLQESKKLSFENSLGAKYSSTDSAIVKVSKKGTIRGISQGTAKIKCKTNTGIAKCTITVNNPTLNITEATTCVDDKFTLKVVGAQEDVTFTSADISIAKVSEKGSVKGIAPGKTTITASVSGIELTCKVLVTKEPTTYENFEVNKNNVYVRDDYKGQLLEIVPKGTVLKVTEVKYSDTYTWGKTKYNSKNCWVVLNSCTYINGTINGKVYTVAPYLTKKSKSIYVGDQYALIVKDSTGETTYKSKKETIATVDENGVVTGVKAGEVNIIATNGKTKMTCKIKVNNPTLNLTTLDIHKGVRTPLEVTGGSGEITWKSSDKNVAKVTKKGIVVGKSFGTAKITATRNDTEISCVVNVYDPILSKEKITVKVRKEKTLNVSQSYSDQIVWKSSNKKIAKVTQKGKVKGVSAGKCTITATVDGANLTCTVKVKK